MAEEKQATEAVEQPDGRLLAVVAAMVPVAAGETPPTEEQKKLALELGKLVEGAQKKAADKAKSPDKGVVDEAAGKFFSGDVGSAVARRIEEEQKKKDEAQQKAAQAAAGQPVASGRSK